jgi:hypothetical protein
MRYMAVDCSAAVRGRVSNNPLYATRNVAEDDDEAEPDLLRILRPTDFLLASESETECSGEVADRWLLRGGGGGGERVVEEDEEEGREMIAYEEKELVEGAVGRGCAGDCCWGDSCAGDLFGRAGILGGGGRRSWEECDLLMGREDREAGELLPVAGERCAGRVKGSGEKLGSEGERRTISIGSPKVRGISSDGETNDMRLPSRLDIERGGRVGTPEAWRLRRGLELCGTWDEGVGEAEEGRLTGEFKKRLGSAALLRFSGDAGREEGRVEGVSGSNVSSMRADVGDGESIETEGEDRKTEDLSVLSPGVTDENWNGASLSGEIFGLAERRGTAGRTAA